MKLINRKNFIPTVCIVYTILSIFKIVLESLVCGVLDNNYENFIWMFAISVIATFALSLHYYLKNFPIWLVMIGQYLVVLALIVLCIWIEGKFFTLHPNAYKDMFWSFTIPYIVGATVYYISFWNEVKRANVIIKYLKEQNRKEG